MTYQEMFEQSFKRPKSFFKLSPRRQWKIDEELGILDWDASHMTPEQMKLFKEHYSS